MTFPDLFRHQSILNTIHYSTTSTTTTTTNTMSDVESMHSAHSEEHPLENAEAAPEAAAETAATESTSQSDDDVVGKELHLSHTEWVGGLNETFHFGSKKHQGIPDELKLPLAIFCLPKDKRRFVLAKLEKNRHHVPIEDGSEEKTEKVEEKTEKKHPAGPE